MRYMTFIKAKSALKIILERFERSRFKVFMNNYVVLGFIKVVFLP